VREVNVNRRRAECDLEDIVSGDIQSSFSDIAFDNAIACLVGAAARKGGWAAALHAIAGAVGAEAASLVTADQSGRLCECTDIGQGLEAVGYSCELKSVSWSRFFRRQDWEDVITPSQHAEALGLAEQFSPAGADASANVIMMVIQDDDFQSVILFSGYDPHLERLVAKFLRRLHAPVRRALQAHCMIRSLKANLAVSERLLDQMPYGVVMLDRTGMVLGGNTTGDQLLDGGGILYVRRGRLVCTDPDENQRLQAAILMARDFGESLDNSSTGDGSAQVMKLYGREGVDPWTVSISPATEDNSAAASIVGHSRPEVIVCVSDRQPITELRARQIAIAYGLSPQEEMITARLSAGDCLSGIADDTKRSVETLRTQLRAVFNKTEIGTQSQLVKLVLSAPLGPPRAPGVIGLDVGTIAERGLSDLACSAGSGAPRGLVRPRDVGGIVASRRHRVADIKATSGPR
jgi:DNA-binding CsgD family transcriptional regulator